MFHHFLDLGHQSTESLTIYNSVPIVCIPCLTTAHSFLYDYSDPTWSGIWPTIWLQISTGLSILTACIPSLKAVLDSWLGQVGSAPMDPPYELQKGGGTVRLQATIITNISITHTTAPAGLVQDQWRRRISHFRDDLITVDDIELPIMLTEPLQRSTSETNSDSLLIMPSQAQTRNSRQHVSGEGQDI